MPPETEARPRERPLALADPYFPPDEQEWLQGQLREILNGRLSNGPRTAEFERRFAEYCGVPYAVAFPSCTACLETALAAWDVGPGDEVLVPAQTFIATAMAVHLRGARPIFTEVSPNDFAMDFDDARSRITERTRGAIVVHFGGVIAAGLPDFVRDMRDRRLFVIEDAAHAPGAELEGRRAGSIGDAGCFSFYPTKVMTTGEGGMLVTTDESVATLGRSLQNRGLDLENPKESYIRVGRNNRFPEIAAAMGISQLRSLPDFLAARRAVAAAYDHALSGRGELRPVLAAPDSAPAYWRYTVIFREPVDREEMKRRLAEEEIAVDWSYEPPVHLQPVCRELFGSEPGTLPTAEDLMSRHVCLPIGPRMLPEDAEHVAERLLHHAEHLASA